MPVLYAATAPFISRVADTPANQQFESSLQSTIRIDRSLSEGSGGYGGWSESVSELSLINSDGFYDALTSNTSLNGQNVAVRLGQFDAAGLIVQPYAMFEQLASLIAEKFSVSRQNLTVFMRDPLAHLQQTLVQTRVFAGTGDLEGGTEIAGKRRPFVGGWVFNVTPVLVIPNELLYQVHDGPLEAILTVRDGGVELTFGGEFATVAALRAAALDGTLYPGLYGTCLREGYFILGGANEKQVTVECYGPQLTTAEIAAWLAAKASGRSVLDDDRHDFLDRAFLANAFTTAIATTSLSTNYVNFFSIDSKSSGKYIFSVLPTVISTSDYGFGFANASASMSLNGSERLGWDSNSVGVYGATGAVLFNGAASGEVGNTFTSNDLVTVAVDIAVRKWWYRIGVGNWNNNALANPATNVGGFNLGFTGDVFAALVLSNIASEDINFRPDGVTPPAGFTMWGPAGSFALDVATINRFEVMQPAFVGCYLDTDSNTTVADLLAQILAGVGGWFSFSTISYFQIFRFDAPTAAESVIGYDSMGGNMVEIDRTNLPDSLDPPPKRRRVKYRRNYTIQTDLFGQITEDDPGLADQFRSDSQLASTTEAQTAAILADFPDAPDPDPVESYFVFEEDALAEANRLLTLYSSGRFPYRFTLRNVLFSHKIGDVVQVTDSRLALSGGKYLRIISLSDDMSPMTTEVIGFG